MERYRQNNTRMSNNGMRMHAPNRMGNYPRVPEGCGCTDFVSVGGHNEATGLAMGKVKSQPWQNIYPCEKGITRGTIFAELDLPFMGRRGGCK